MSLANRPPVTFILVTHMERARSFYTEVLGLVHTGSDAFADSYDLGGTLLRVTHVPGWTPSAHTVIGWLVDDVEATVAALTARGVAFLTYEGFGQSPEGIWSSPDGSARIAWFNDPDGNNLSLTQIG